MVGGGGHDGVGGVWWWDRVLGGMGGGVCWGEEGWGCLCGEEREGVWRGVLGWVFERREMWDRWKYMGGGV